MVTNIKRFIKGCSMWQQSKELTTAPHGLLNPVPIPATWFDIWPMDYITNLPVIFYCNAVFICIDKFMKYVYLTPCFVGKGQLSAAQCDRLFFDIIVHIFGVPKAVLHDYYPCFTSYFWPALCDILQTKIFLISAYHPQSDRQTDCTHQMLEQVLRCLLCESLPPAGWSYYLRLRLI